MEKLNKISRWICIQQVLGYGSHKVKDILKVYKSSKEFFNLPSSEWKNSRIFTERELLKLKNFDFSVAENLQKRCMDKGYKIVTYEDVQYPERLKNIYNPPALFYVNGSFPDVDRLFCISIVGTRSATNYGLKIAFDFAHNLAEMGVVVVSGGALGIDSSAQRGALLAGGEVISVLGCGLECNYLEKNRDLRKAIAKNGAVITEYGLDDSAVGRNFPMRNRIISALSLGTLIVEAGIKSGALITANLALEQNRDVFAVPGDIRSKVSMGTNNLIKECAKPVTCVEDILEEYYSKFPDLTVKLKKNAENIEKSRKIECADVDISKKAGLVLNSLEKDKAMLLDELVMATKMSIPDVLQAITELELKNLIKSEPGRKYRKNY